MTVAREILSPVNEQPLGARSTADETSMRPRILVVDDDDRNLLTISEVLKGLGEIDRARSGEEALRHLLKVDYAVILLDVLMPGLDGYQTAELIRKRESSRASPIIFLTAINKEDAHMLRGYDSGAVGFLFKPFNPTMLRSKVSVFVDLFLKTAEIRQKAAIEQRLLEENLRANAEKLEAVRALRRAEKRQDAILRALPVCIHSRSVEAPFCTTFMSDSVEALTGFSPQTFLERPQLAMEHVHPEDLPVLQRALTEALVSRTYECEFRWRCSAGDYRYFLDQGVLSRDEQGDPVEFFGTLLDTTERRRLEDQLVHAQKLDAIGKLTGGVAHDFNNLLASVLSGLSLLQRRLEMSDEASRILSMTQHAANQGADLVARMLTFSRRQNLNPRLCDIKNMSESLDALLSPVLGGRVTLSWEIQEDLWPAFVDPGQLELSVMNLVINARDAMSEGGRVTIWAGNRTALAGDPSLSPGDYVIIRVADNGPGITPENLLKVLDPFFTTKEVGRGTGLGLSTTYGFAKQSGGDLRIESVWGEGASVELWLPRAEQASEKAPPLTLAGGMKAQKVSSNQNILLVDDAVELLDFTANLLREAGLSVTAIGSGVEALALLEKEAQRFDVIITDFAMPLVSGVDVIRFARTKRAGWPAILITGYAEDAAIQERPANVPILYKPFAQEQLLTMLARVTEVSGLEG